MKICPACRRRFEGDDFRCRTCDYFPVMHDGYPAFAPALISTYDGFKSDYFSSLAKLEAGNFWFESRNRLLTWSLGRYFPNAKTMLEIGCGTGFVLQEIRRRFPAIKLFGSDIFTEGFAYAKERVPGVPFFQMDVRSIPFENEFDVIGAFDVIEHIEEDEIVLSRIFQAVKLRGGIILTVPQHQWLWSNKDEIACHKRRYSKKELSQKIENAGFHLLHLTSFFSFLLPLMTISRLIFRLGDAKQDRGGELRPPPLINAFLKRLCDIELALLKNGALFPAGGSLLCVAIKA